MGRLGPAAPTCCPRSTPTRSRGRAACRCCCRRGAAGRRRGRRGRRRLDGLVVTGGADVDPARYGARAAPAHGVAGAPTGTPGRSPCSTAADARGLPVLGVCRGMQLMAVHRRRLARPAPARRGRPRDALPGGDAFGDVEVHDRRRAPGCGCWSVTRVDGRLPPPPVASPPHPGFDGRRVRRGRHARGDGGTGRRASAWRCSGTRRRGRTPACSPAWWRPRPRPSPEVEPSANAGSGRVESARTQVIRPRHPRCRRRAANRCRGTARLDVRAWPRRRSPAHRRDDPATFAGDPSRRASRGRGPPSSRPRTPTPRARHWSAAFYHPRPNAYYPLVPGTVSRLRGTDEGVRLRETVTVTRRHRTIQGVRTTVVLDVLRRRDGTLAERTHDWYAADNRGTSGTSV